MNASSHERRRDPILPHAPRGAADRRGSWGRRPRGDGSRSERDRVLRRTAGRGVTAAAEKRPIAREGVQRHARRGDEGRPDTLGRRPRARARGDQAGVPGDPRDAPAERRTGLVQGDREGRRAGSRREAEGRVRGVRARADRGGIDRTGAPRHAARRASRRGQDPISRESRRRSTPTFRTCGSG